MVNPRITIETLLQRVQPGDINALERQLASVSASSNVGMKALTDKQLIAAASVQELSRAYSLGLNRQMIVNSAKVRIATGEIADMREGLQLTSIVLKNMSTPLGMLNAALNIVISRFGTMVLVFGVFRAISSFIARMKEGFEAIDSEMRKVASVVIPTSGDMSKAMTTLGIDMITFAMKTGVALKEAGDAMYYMASAGMQSDRIHRNFIPVMKLIISTSKDLAATTEETKKVSEIFMGLVKVFGEDVYPRFNSEQKATEYMAGVMYKTFQREQILLEELAMSLTYSSEEAHKAGISYEELVVTLGFLNTYMLKGSKAGTSYANSIRDAIQNADKLQSVFGVNLKNVGQEGFSFINEVIVPLNKKFKETGFNLKTITDLMQIWNLRSIRAMSLMISLADQLNIKLNDVVTGEEAMNKAFEIINDSYKIQKQRTDALTNAYATMFAVGITGGKGFGLVLKDINNNLEHTDRVMARLAATIGMCVVMLKSIFKLLFEIIRLPGKGLDLILKINQRLEKTLSIFSKINEFNKNLHEWINLIGWAEKLAEKLSIVGDKTGNIYRLIKYAKGDMSKLVEVVSDITPEAEKALKKFQEFEDTTDHVADSVRSWNTLLDSSYKIVSKISGVRITGQELTTDLKASLASQKQFAVELSKTYGAMYDSGLSGAENYQDVLNKVTDLIKKQSIDLTVLGAAEANQLNQLFDALENSSSTAAKALRDTFTVEKKTRAESIHDLDISLRNKLQLLDTEYQAELQKLDLFQIDKDILEMKHQRDRTIALEEWLKSLSELNIQYLDKLISDMQSKWDKIDSQFKRFRENFNKHILGIPLSDITIDLGFKINWDMIVPPDMSQFQKEIYESLALFEVKDDLETAWKTDIADIIDAGLSIMNENVRTRGRERAKLTEDQEELIRNMYYASMKDINAMIEAKYKERGKILLDSLYEFIDASKEFNEEQKRLSKAVLGGISITDEERRKGTKALDEIMSGQNQTMKDAILQVRSLGEEMDAIKKKLGDLGLSDVWEQLAVSLGIITAGVREDRKELEDFTRKWEGINDAISNTIRIFSSLATIMDADISPATERFLKIMDALAGTINDVTGAMERLKDAKIKDDIFGQIAGITGIISGVAGGIAAIFSAMHKEKEDIEKLAQEYIPEDFTKQIAPDFGQARVIQNRITLQPVFQFLDAEQLTPARQRSLAETIWDELVEISKSKGEAFV